jgi:hypothetical protein
MSMIKKSVSVGASVFLLSAVAFSASAFAGNEGAHGGQGVVCQDSSGKISSIQMYDYYEGSIYLNSAGTLDVGPTTGNYQDNISYVLNRLAKIDSVAAARYQERALAFESEMALLDDAQMVSIGDAHHVINPDTGCYTDQFAVQFFNLKPGQTKRYFVNKDLWKVADTVAKAGLVLHEVIYRDAVDVYGQSDSDLTRYFNYMISSTALNSISPDSYRAIVVASKFVDTAAPCLFSVAYDGIPLCNKPVLITQDSKVFGVDFPVGGYLGYLAQPSSFRLHSGQEILIQGNSGYSGQIAFDSNMNLRLFVLAGTTDVQIHVGQYDLAAKAGINMVIYPDRNVQALVPQANVTLPTSSGSLPFAGSSVLNFFDDGTIQGGTLAVAAPIMIGGQTLNVIPGPILFDTSGVLIQVEGTDPFTTKIGGSAAQIISASQFFPNGQIQTAYVPGDQSFIDSHGATVKLKNGTFGRVKIYLVQFDSNGRLVSSSEVAS